MSNYVGTGVCATDEEREDVLSRARAASRIPVIAFSSGPDLASQAWGAVYRRVHELALAHGLPEIEGYYGMDEDGQFVEAALAGGERVDLC